MYKIRLAARKFALVSAEDFNLCRLVNWKLHHTGYAYSEFLFEGRRYFFYMHQFLLGYRAGKEIDHKNRNRLDNRRVNLRFASRGQNIQNTVERCRGRSKYRGVVLRHVTQGGGKRWSAQVGVERRKIGYFKTEAAAAKAYNRYAREKFGRYAVLNKIVLPRNKKEDICQKK